MDTNNSGGHSLSDRRSSASVNGSGRRQSPISGPFQLSGRQISLPDSPNPPSSQHGQYHINKVIVNKDERGYGMKVSGDNPVYVQSVKQGGAAEKAGLHAGDKIMEVNGVNVISSTHTEVVGLIKSSSQVVLTVQQRTTSGNRSMSSPSHHHTRPNTTSGIPGRITGPQPVDTEKQYQLQVEREQYFRLMIEKEQRYVDLLRSQIAKDPDEKKYLELEKTERNLQKLQGILHSQIKPQFESPNTHHRTKSSPESLSNLSMAEASHRLINSESLNDLSGNRQGGGGYESMTTPPGTPPPPYPSPLPGRRQSSSNRNSSNTDDGDGGSALHDDGHIDAASPDISPIRGGGRIFALNNSSPIHAATPQTTQQSIISPEDDEISDQETSHLDHGPFKSLSRLWEHTPHLAVFTNYILKSNADPNSLLFYLLTDLYKEGNAKEMRKWAFEIHSCFLMPGSPLRLSNVDENIAREIDDVLTREYDKEEILRKIFWKARNRAKEELTKQLDDFQQKRIRGLSTLYGGPPDSTLNDLLNNKTKEQLMYESLFAEALERLSEDIDKESIDPKRYFAAAALGTVITRVFNVRTSWNTPDRFPFFVNKERRSNKLIGKLSRKLNIQGHQYVAQQYYTVVQCNHCHQIVYGIGPQGYHCTVCLINLHRLCVKLYEDICPGPINKTKQSLQNFIMEKISRHEPKDLRDRRKPGHFIAMERERRCAEEKDESFDSSETGEQKPGHPVTRTGSDRRPDAVREESINKGGAGGNQENQNASPERSEENVNSTVSLPASAGHKRGSSNITRSESVKQQSEKQRNKRRNISDPLHNQTPQNEIVDLSQEGSQELSHTDSSASNSSLSSRSSDSPSTSIDAVANLQHGTPSSVWDSDMEVEADPPDWQSTLTEEEINRLHPHEKKRQDVINELFHTERTHVRNLKVLRHVFLERISSSKVLKPDEIKLVFSNVKDVLEMHTEFNKTMKSKRREERPVINSVGDILLNMFDGCQGDAFKKAAATFCERQQLALEFIKERRKKDSRFESILKDCETNKECRRLPLQGIITTEMQRLSKYPLLIERVIDHVQKLSKNNPDFNEELNKLKQAHTRSKEILNHVNDAAKQALNQARLEEIQKHLDTTQFDRNDHLIVQEFRNLDLTRYKLLHEGSICLNRPNKAPLPVHLLVLEEAVIILQREGEKYLLKFFHTGGSQSSAPILKMANVLVRPNAAEKDCLFLLNSYTASVQMYDLKAKDPADMRRWFRHLSEAAEAYNRREGKSNRNRGEPAPEPEEETVQELPPSNRETASERAAESITTTSDHSSPITTSTTTTENENSTSSATAQADSDGLSTKNCDYDENNPSQRLSSSSEETNKSTNTNTATNKPPGSEVGGGASVKLAADDWPLIQPSEMQVIVPPVHKAESVLTPLEKIKRKDEELRQALSEKESLVADFLSIPREDYHTIADMASTHESPTALNESSSSGGTSGKEHEHDPIELALGAVFNSNKIIHAIADSLCVTEADIVASTGGKYPACASNELPLTNNNNIKKSSTSNLPSIPVNCIKDIATTLNKQLSLLLSVVKQREEERDRLKKELHRTQEQLHEQLGIHGPQSNNENTADAENNDNSTASALDCTTQSGDLESIEESPTENE